ncbi:guanine nucleotide binding protein, alpha subunit [Mycotypha africana]|uniref:guanine nucleotide binding protein, alpha subunit n=1 Tax=Mycotypha africana TaxID=64632 RepID=UPI00230165FA|nr:guanine nucleotide binding protein, alpha subunit [Mycotypha africana]KAI8979410.1 guanine nucleotide binding protein, alpha subunit [Mycotypha africana]
MGLCHSSEEENHESKRSNEIDRLIEKEKGNREKQCKVLLLGSGESGKSTILKQMKIINLNGYSADELFTWRATVYRNVMECVQTIVQALMDEEIPFETAELNENVDRILSYRVSGNPKSQISPEIVALSKLLWKDPVVISCLKKREPAFYLMDSAPYFFENLDRIGQASYVPNEQDVLRARLKTTGITEIQFQLGGLNIHMFDVGGQRSERKKWIHCFDAVTSIIFCVALSEYDQVLLEESNQNRMLESLALFESIVNSRWFIHSSIMLFLNKVDLFKAKITSSPLENYFPDYGGGSDANKAAKYILWRFLQCNRNKLNIYPHLTQATDTSNIRFVFAAVKETLLQNALRDSGML